jgi:hypothetical protein
VAILFRSASPEAARKAVDAVLLAKKGIALESRPWKDSAEVDSSTGRARREIEKEAREWKDAPAALPLDRVREVRIRAGDLEKLREALGAASVLREAGLLTLQGAPTETSVEEARRLLGGLADLEKAAEGGSTPVPPGGSGSAAAGGRGDAGPEAPGAGKPPPADHGEPVPPPAPTEETLRRLAEAPPPRAGAAVGKDPDAEVWVEIHVVGGTVGSGRR